MRITKKPGALDRACARRALLGVPLALAAILLLAPGAAAQAATVTVNTLADNAASPSECAGAPADCSLRQALDKAQSGDTVAVPGAASPYVLVLGAIAVRGGVTIAGAGAEATVLSGNKTSQVLNMLGPAPVTIRSLTITEALNSTSIDGGGAINDQPKSGGGLTLEGVVVSESSSRRGFGGAIEVGAGDLVISHSRFVADSASIGTLKGGGGAIDDFAGEGTTLSISDSVFEEDSTDKHRGGALLVESGTALAITGSTFNSNFAGEGASGGAIFLDAKDPATIYNSTFTANRAGSGGAISSETERLTLVNDTLSGNGAEVGANLDVVAGTTTSENTIFAAPFPEGVASCAGEVRSAGHNLEDSSPSECGLSASAGDLVGVSPGLGALANNFSQDATPGGPPPTLALSASSLAVGTGSAAGCAAVGWVDERGFPRPGIEGSGCDIGAFELLAGVPTSTTLATSSAQIGPGQPLTLTVAVSTARALPAAVPPAGGTVEFRDGATLIGTAAIDAAGHASLTTSALGVGSHSLSAVYGGDALRAGSSSIPVFATVLGGSATPAAPRLGGLRQSNRRWREGTRLAGLARARRPPLGTTFAFTLNTPATLLMTFTRVLPGRRQHGRCVAPSRRNRRARACRRTLTAAALTLAGARAGANRISFQGRVSRGRRLAPGNYTLVLSASNAVGRSAPLRIGFTIVRG